VNEPHRTASLQEEEVAIRVEKTGDDTPAVTTAEVVSGLNDLLQLDHDAIGAYEIAIEQLRNREHALQIEGYKRDHERHIRELNDLILSLGGSPTNEPHATAPLKQGMQKIAAAAGDRALLLAWRANELQVMSKYDGYAQKAVFWPSEAKRLIDRNALDEEKHYQWAVRVVGGGDLEVDLANTVREGMTRVRELSADAQEKLVEATAHAKLRAAEGLAGAAEYLESFAEERAGQAGGSAQVAEGAQRLSRGLGTAAVYLREGGSGGGAGESLPETIAREIRANPARGLLATFAVGFILGRIIR
jgi:hypothetical protein